MVCGLRTRSAATRRLPDDLWTACDKVVDLLLSYVTCLPHYAMHKRGIRRCAVPVCLSVCLSVTFVYSAKTSKYILKLFSSSGSHTILVFRYQTLWQYSDPLTGAKIAIFDQYLALGSMSAGVRVSSICSRPWRRFITADADDDRHASVNLVYDSNTRRRF